VGLGVGFPGLGCAKLATGTTAAAISKTFNVAYFMMFLPERIVAALLASPVLSVY